MSATSTAQQKMDAAFDNYLALSSVLQDDLHAMLAVESEAAHWRRSFVLSSTAMVEGYGHCIRQMCAVSFDCESPDLGKKDAAVVADEARHSLDERTKRTLRAAYKLFGLGPQPAFGGREWSNAKRLFEKRDHLAHPKSPADLKISDEVWAELRGAVAWVLGLFFNFIALVVRKFGARHT